MIMARRAFLAAMAPFFAQRSKGLNRPRANADRPGMRSDGNPDIIDALRPLKKAHNVPGLTAAIVRPGQRTRVGAVGVRKIGSPEKFGAGDVVHIGSCTKAMTSTMIATLVGDGKLSWATTLAEVFPDVAMHEDFRKVNLTQLLNHRAGFPANADWWNLGRDKPTTEQRRVALEVETAKAPQSKPGETFLYSNLGYAIAGLMAETVMKTSWEDLMRERLFKPLEMTTAGFGPPGTKGSVDQPWGHTHDQGKAEPGQFDNAAALGPAGTVHCTMEDWGKFVALHLRGARGESTRILKPETFRKLQSPPIGGDYAFGWSVLSRSWAGGKVLTHNGSNTWWYCVVWAAPKLNAAFISATNQAGSPAEMATDEAVSALIDLLNLKA